VAIGIALDACIATEMGMLEPAMRDRILHLLHALGLPTNHSLLQPVDRLLAGLEQFRQHLGGSLAIPLITRPGSFQETHQRPAEAVTAAVSVLARHAV
jgi:3-dehydroquinate synthase